MPEHFIYGKIDNLWIFLRAESATVLPRLWATLGAARTWGEVRESLGERVAGVLLRTSEFDGWPGDQEPFIWSPTIRALVETWTVDELLKISAREIPYVCDLVQTPATMRFLAQYLRASADREAYVVLQLTGLGCLADRDDDRIAQCLAVPDCPAENPCVPPVRLG
jgi:hypothetical protein